MSLFEAEEGRYCRSVNERWGIDTPIAKKAAKLKGINLNNIRNLLNVRRAIINALLVLLHQTSFISLDCRCRGQQIFAALSFDILKVISWYCVHDRRSEVSGRSHKGDNQPLVHPGTAL